MDATTFLAGPISAAESPSLRALWHMAQGDWQHAHSEIDDGEDPDSMWVHAHLHRVEGDAVNAAYWYRMAGKPVYKGSFQTEQEEMLATLLSAR